MEADDALSRDREERTVSHHGRCVRLDADAEQHDHIDIGMFGHELGISGTVSRFAAGHVDQLFCSNGGNFSSIALGIHRARQRDRDGCRPWRRPGPQPPTVVTTTTRSPSGSGCVERRRRFEYLFDIPRADEPGTRHMPSNTASSREGGREAAACSTGS